MKFKRNVKIELGLKQIDIIPVVNCAFLLIMFIVLLSPWALQDSLKVKLPKAITSEIFKEEAAVIFITGENVMYINNNVTTAAELRKTLSKIPKNLPVFIKSDRHASIGRIVDIWNICRDFGIERINIATTSEK